MAPGALLLRCSCILAFFIGLREVIPPLRSELSASRESTPISNFSPLNVVPVVVVPRLIQPGSAMALGFPDIIVPMSLF